jgi:hypothetical protein
MVRTGRLLLAGLAGAILAAALPPAASAGTYTVHSCRFANGAPAATGGWAAATVPAPLPGAGTEASCPTGGSLRAWVGRLDATPAGGWAQWAFSAPPDTRIAAYVLDRGAAAVEPGLSYGYELWELASGAADALVERCSLHLEPGPDCSLMPASIRRTARPRARELQLRAVCFPTSEGCGTFSEATAAEFQLRRAELTLVDDSLPRLRSLGGPLIEAPGPHAGVDDLRLSAADRGGGIAAAVVELDGAAVQTFGTGCAEPFTDPVPCPLGIDRSLAIDLSRVSQGTHTLRVLVRDAAGGTAASAPVMVAVDNRPRVPNGTPASDRARLTACLQQRRPCTRRRPRSRGRLVMAAGGSRARLLGTLRTPSGAPIAGARLEILARPRMTGARWRTTATVVTSRRGRYSWRVPKGPSRDLAVTYRASSVAATIAARAEAHLLVRAAVVFAVVPSVVREGATVTLRGTLPGRPRPRSGKLVALQAAEGRRWRTFATTRAGRRSGRFSYTHRFPVVGVSRTHRLRASVPREGSYPYVSGHSRPVTVRVRGA